MVVETHTHSRVPLDIHYYYYHPAPAELIGYDVIPCYTHTLYTPITYNIYRYVCISMWSVSHIVLD